MQWLHEPCIQPVLCSQLSIQLAQHCFFIKPLPPQAKIDPTIMAANVLLAKALFLFKCSTVIIALFLGSVVEPQNWAVYGYVSVRIL